MSYCSRAYAQMLRGDLVRVDAVNDGDVITVCCVVAWRGVVWCARSCQRNHVVQSWSLPLYSSIVLQT